MAVAFSGANKMGVVTVTQLLKWEDLPDLLLMSEFMTYLRITKSKAYPMVERGIVTAYKVGGEWRIPKVCVKEYLDSVKTGQKGA